MLDIGWTELVVIAIVLIVVVGPKDLPPMLRAFGKMMTKFRGMASDFRQQFDDALKEADLDDVRKTLSDAQKLNPAHSLREAMNPLRQMGNDIKADLQKATSTPVKTETPPVQPVTSAEPASVPGELPAVAVPAPVIDPIVANPVLPVQETPAAPRKPRRAVKEVAAAQPASVVAEKAAKPAKKAAGLVETSEKPRKSPRKTVKKGDA